MRVALAVIAVGRWPGPSDPLLELAPPIFAPSDTIWVIQEKHFWMSKTSAPTTDRRLLSMLIQTSLSSGTTSAILPNTSTMLLGPIPPAYPHSTVGMGGSIWAHMPVSQEQ